MQQSGWIYLANQSNPRALSKAQSEQLSARPDEIGDEAYDAYLFAAGENNRIQIESIIDGSAAQLAGIELGDVVVSYADATIYHTRELQNATRDGLRSESISVVVLRSGQHINLVIPRGPLGVTLRSVRQPPPG